MTFQTNRGIPIRIDYDGHQMPIEMPFIYGHDIIVPQGMRARIILNVDELITDGDDYFFFDFCEFEASIAIIGWILGKEFMKRELDPIDRTTRADLRLRPDISKKGARHLTDYGEGWCKVIALSKYLEVIREAKHFESKIKEFEGERFDAILYELKLASHLMTSGCELEFVPPIGGGKSVVEFIVGGGVKVECKRKGSVELDEGPLRNCLMDFILSSSKKFGNGHGCLFILIPTKAEISSRDQLLIIAVLSEVLRDLSIDDATLEAKFDCIVIWNEYMQTNVDIGINALKTSPILIRRGENYSNLPQCLKKAIESPTSVHRRRYWINFKMLGR